MSNEESYADTIAIIGLHGRFPGAGSPEALWETLRAGTSSIRSHSRDELRDAGIDDSLLDRDDYVRAYGELSQSDCFDADFFGCTPREAARMDPQHRVLLECAWHTLEHAGYDPGRYPGLIGVYAGIAENGDRPTAAGGSRTGFLSDDPDVFFGNSADFCVTRICYKCDLRGPGLCIKTGCSSSLVAVHLAAQALLAHECDMALAGGVSIAGVTRTGYLHEVGGILSPDGHCRAFDRDAAGTVPGDGVGLVLLKRTEDAIADGDTIHAILRGSAINNDGRNKVGFTAPGVTGQEDVIRMAMQTADVRAEDITYVETHGTATPIGDPIELDALSAAFASTTQPRRCAIGSVKTNIGHLNTAAGIAGLIKTILCLEHGELVPSLDFSEANPELRLPTRPFSVCTETRAWTSPRLAGVSSFGMGGTNAHVILSQGPAAPARPPVTGPHLLLVSGATPMALGALSSALASSLEGASSRHLADASFTLANGRAPQALRRYVLAEDHTDATRALRAGPAATQPRPDPPDSVVFLFPGQGTQFPGMGHALYARERVYRQWVDHLLDVAAEELSIDLRPLLCQAPEDGAEATNDTIYIQPALYIMEYALAQLLDSYGVVPDVMVGHSLGEYVAAALSHVFTAEDGLRLVCRRARLMQECDRGAMLAVRLPESQLSLPPGLSIAAVNAPDSCVVSGEADEIHALAARYATAHVETKLLETSHAFHSDMMSPCLARFARAVADIPLAPPRIPFLSNLTGAVIEAGMATDPDYWARQMRQPVRFSQNVTHLMGERRLYLEVGPGQTLSSLVQQHAVGKAPVTTIPVQPRGTEGQRGFLGALGAFWVAGGTVEWSPLGDPDARRVPLPVYPFERHRFPPHAPAPREDSRRPVEEWFYVPVWRRVAAVSSRPTQARVLVVSDGRGFADAVAAQLRGRGAEVTLTDAVSLPAALGADSSIDHVVHCAALGGADGPGDFHTTFASAQETGLHHVAALVRLLGARRKPCRLLVVTDCAVTVESTDRVIPEKATLIGALPVFQQEYPHLRCSVIDVPRTESVASGALVAAVVAELFAEEPALVTAHRGSWRYLRDFSRIRCSDGESLLRAQGVYLVTGGLGRVGLLIAEFLARHCGAHLVLTTRKSQAEVEADRALGERLSALPRAGGTVAVLTADAGSRADMQAVLTEIRQRYGRLDGVIHAAAYTDGGAFRPLQETGPDTWARHNRAKVEALYILRDLLAEEPPDFVLLMSSIATVLGGLGFAAYAAANSFMDEFAATAGPGWIAVDWDGWQEEGYRGDAGRFAMSARQGLQALQALLTRGQLPRVIVSTTDLGLRQQAATAPAESATGEAESRQSASESGTDEKPSDALHSALQGIWRDVLGVEAIGVHDSFFDLRGDSLRAIKVVARIRESMGLAATPDMLFAAPTIAALASRLNGQQRAADVSLAGFARRLAA